jgi:hypothetical protein
LQWVTLEDVKSGMIHLELTWFSLMDDPVMLKMVNAIKVIPFRQLRLLISCFFFFSPARR